MGAIMKLILKNVGSIEQGEIHIEEGRFNIKYATNGTGKSSFARFLKAFIESNEVEKNKFIPLGTEKEPSLSFDIAAPRSCMLFNEDYINSYLFQSEDVLNNTIRLIRLTPEVSQAMNDYDVSVAGIRNAINNPAIEGFIRKIDEISATLKLNEKGNIHGSCKLAKATKNGANVLHPNSDTVNFGPNIESPNSPLWYKWHSDGEQYAISCCPYCGQKLPHNFNTIKSALKTIFEQTDAKNNVQIRSQLTDVSTYLIRHSGLDCLLSTTSKPSKKIYTNAINEIKTLDTIRQKITKAHRLDPFELRRMNTVTFVNNLRELSIDSSCISDDDFKDAIKVYNDQLATIVNAATAFQDAVQKCDIAISKAVKNFNKYINDYLSRCGIPYSFVIEQNDSEHARAKLIKNMADCTSVDVPNGTLSYGEKNCLCLALFAIDVCQHNPEIVILDDPVSSFDNGKRFAMFYLLFSDKEFTLKNKTVVLLTHDITPLIDFVKRRSGGVDDAKGWKLINKNGILSEVEICSDDIDSSIVIEKKLASDNQKSLVVRLIHARRYCEINGKTGAVYSFISSLLHGNPAPTILDTQGNERTFTPLEENEAISDLNELSLTMDYSQMLSCLDEATLVSDYKNSHDDYERMAIARVLLDKYNRHLGKPYDYVLNSMFHIEQENLFNCSLFAEECIPSYVVAFVDGWIKEAYPSLK